MAKKAETQQVEAAIVHSDGAVEQTTVGWRPMDMSAEAVAERDRISENTKPSPSKTTPRRR